MSGGLTNADFRRLLATPRPTPGGGGRGGGRGDDSQKKKPKKPGGGGGRGHGPGGKPGDKEGPADDGSKYRDRAEERRKGLSADFEGVPDDLVGLLQGQADLRTVSYEDSKYLGGDIAHTHLVKGLDFALLQKVRAEQDNKKKGNVFGDGSDDEDEGAPKALARKVELPGQQAAPTFHTAMGRAVHAFFFDPAQRGPGLPVAELFLPRRTAFVYDMEDPEAGDIPTTLRRSKEDCPKVQEMSLGGLDAAVIDKIARIMSYMTVQGGGKRKLKKKERAALLRQHGLAVQGAVKGAAAAEAKEQLEPAAAEQQAAARGPEDDGDIFGDAGTDYEPTVKKDRAAEQGEQEARRGGYFGEDLHADLPPLPKPGEEQLGDMQGPAAGPTRPPAGYDAAAAYASLPEDETAQAAGASAHDAVADLARKERAKEKEKKRAVDILGGGDDSYAECFPSYYDYGTVAMEDSDDEGAPPSKQGGLSRRDFASEAEWQEYQASGVASRQAEGRAKVRQQQRVASKEKNKVASQLGKIQKIMEDKGLDHASAFTKASKGGGGGGGGDDFGGPPGAAMHKKRRI